MTSRDVPRDSPTKAAAPRREAPRAVRPRVWFALAATVLGWILACGPAEARLSQQQLARVAAAPEPDARAPLDLAFEDAVSRRTLTLGQAAGGRATLVLPVDYTCANVCDPMLAMTSAALAATGLRAGADYALVLVGLDPRDGVEAARRMLAGAPGLDPVPGLAALVGGEAAVGALTGALGYGFVPDAETDSIAHPAAAMLLTPEGRVARVLSPLALNGRDLRLALVEASEGRVGGLGDRLALLCYGFDGVKGVYTPLIRRFLSAGAVLTILAIALGVMMLRRREGPA